MCGAGQLTAVYPIDADRRIHLLSINSITLRMNMIIRTHDKHKTYTKAIKPVKPTIPLFFSFEPAKFRLDLLCYPV